MAAGTDGLSFSLDYTGCSATTADGGWGFCGPESCRNEYVTCPSEDDGGGVATVDSVTGEYSTGTGDESGCSTFLERTSTADNTDWNPTGSCDSSCTQVTTGVCSAEFLANVLVGDGVKSAFCNDKWLVLTSSGEPSLFTANLNDVPSLPGGVSSTTGTVGVTGMDTLDLSTIQGRLRYPLSIELLSTADGDNNVEYYDANDGVSAKSHLVDDDLGGVNYGLPSDAGIGLAVNGQTLFPVYNNVARFTPSICEVDSCNEHVGQGGGQPHFHGDPFGDQVDTNCVYGPSNYSGGSVASHPPIIGFAYDGILIYGRYLDENAPGYQAPLLDACGGHVHDDATDVDEHGFSLADYHYHAQAFDGVCDKSRGCVAEDGEVYLVSTTGPYNCFKADIGHPSMLGSSALIAATADDTTYYTLNEMDYHCSGMTDYYLLTGLNFNNPTASLDSSSSCDAPAAPSGGVYEEGPCATAGDTLYSGWSCRPTCDDGFEASGTTRCVGGVITEATCEALPTDAPTSSPAPTPPPSSSPTGAPTVSPAPSAAPSAAPAAAESANIWLALGLGLGFGLPLVAGAVLFYHHHRKPHHLNVNHPRHKNAQSESAVQSVEMVAGGGRSAVF